MGIDTEIYQIYLRKNTPDILAKLVNFKGFAVLLYSASLISSEALEISKNEFLGEYDRKFEIFTYLRKTLTCDKYRKIIDLLVESENELCANILKEAVNTDPENESEWVKKLPRPMDITDPTQKYRLHIKFCNQNPPSERADIYSVGGYIEKEDRVEIYPDECGRRLIPSIVAFSDSGRILVGQEARDQMEINPGNTIFNVKRIIGRIWNDPVVQKFRKTVPYQIINEDGRPKIRIKTAKLERNYSPEEISAIILTKMKEIAEINLNQKVELAIITAPAYFNDAQRNTTKCAGEMTGLTILKIINEPTAAALAYNLDPNQKISERAILVYDLGGGTFDVSVLDIGGEEEDNLSGDFAFIVEGTSGLTYLGGEDFNNKIIDYFAQICKDKYHKDIRQDPRSMQKLQIEVEKAKRILSEFLTTKIKIENFLENETFNEVLTREKFEELNKDLFERTISILKMVVDDAKSKKGVDKFAEIILVGGSTRIPKIQELVRNCFENGEEIITGFCPDEAIAYGAALYARILAVGHKKVGFLLEITPLSLGVEAIGGRFTCIVPKNTAIPIKYSKIFSTSKDYQTEVEVNVYEGEEKLASDNNLLGTFYLTGITPAKWGIPQIKVTLQVDSNGFLQVSAKEKQTGNKNKIKIMTSRGNSGGNPSENSKNSKISKFSKEEMDMRNELSLLIFQKRFQLCKSYIEDEDNLSEFEKIIKESETVLNLATDGDEILRMANYWQQILKLENIFNECNEANILGDGR